MSNFEIRTVEEPDSAVVRPIDDMLIAFNEEKMAVKRRSTAIIAYENEEPLGGIYFRCYGRSAVIDLLGVKKKWRHQGIGWRLLEAAEQEVRGRGCRHITVDSMIHQAPEFYYRFGYENIATIPDYYHHHKRFVLRKTLTKSGEEE